MQFIYQNIQFQKHEKENWLVVRGEIKNNSSVNYNAVAFRLIVFIKNIPVGNTVFTVNGFGARQKKVFEKRVGELDYNKVIDKITRWEIHPEGAY